MKTNTARTRSLVGAGLVAVLLTLGTIGGLVRAADKSSKKDAMVAFMRMKLAYTQGITEGLTMEKFDLVSRNAVKLRDMTVSNIWTQVEQPDYKKFTEEYQKSCDGLYKAAVEKDLGDVEKSYNKVLKNCVECHQDLRAKQGLEKKITGNDGPDRAPAAAGTVAGLAGCQKGKENSMSSTERNMAALMDDMKDVMRDVDELLKGIPKDLSEEGRKAKRQLEETMDTAKLRYRQLEKRATQGLRVTDEWVRERPYPVVGSAFGIGLLIGLLVGHRH